MATNTENVSGALRFGVRTVLLRMITNASPYIETQAVIDTIQEELNALALQNLPDGGQYKPTEEEMSAHIRQKYGPTRKAAAEALRKAADAALSGSGPFSEDCAEWAKWLRARANQYDEPVGEDGYPTADVSGVPWEDDKERVEYGHIEFVYDAGLTPGEKRQSAILQAVGAASTCWESLRQTGVFDEKRANGIAEALRSEVDRLSGRRVEENDAYAATMRAAEAEAEEGEQDGPQWDGSDQSEEESPSEGGTHVSITVYSNLEPERIGVVVSGLLQAHFDGRNG